MLRKKVQRVRSTDNEESNGVTDEVHPLVGGRHAANPWADAGPSSSQRDLHRLSFDPASGVIMLPEGDEWLMDFDDDDSSDEGTPASGEVTSDASQEDLVHTGSVPPASPSKRRHGTYYHHPERRRSGVPGAFSS